MRTETLLKIPFIVTGRCSSSSRPFSLIICNENAPKFCCQQAAFSMILQDHRWLPFCLFSVKIAAVGSLKRVTKRIVKIIQKFAERQAGENFFSARRKQTILKNISEYLEIHIDVKITFIPWPMSIRREHFWTVFYLWDIFSLYVGYDSYAAPIGANAAWGADKAAPASGSGQGWALFYNPLIDMHQLHNKKN